MGRIAFVFSGQGDQHPGMGAALCERYPAARAVFERLDALRPETSKQCFSGTDEQLRQTANTQPCLYAMEAAAAAALSACGLRADMAAGFSLGELTAIAYAQAVSVEDGFSLVCRRGALMQRDAERNPAAMAAVLKLSEAQVEEICARHDQVFPVNYNSPGQIVVSGAAEAMPAFYADVKQAGGRTMPLKVGGGFHSPFMKEAAEAFARELAQVGLRAPMVEVYSDVTAEPYPAEIAPTLSKQICAPVRWERLVRNMIRDGATAFVEIGPGKTLSRLIGRIDGNVKALSVADCEDLEALCAEVRGC